MFFRVFRRGGNEAPPSLINGFDVTLLIDICKAIASVSADKGYHSDANMKAIDAHNAVPFIPFKSNSRYGVVPGASRKKSDVWHKMFHYYMFRKDEFLRHYHRRSNVETTFHMIKAKFGSRIRSKTPIAQTNEVLCKILCHNLCVLVQSTYELGIQTAFWKEAC